MRAFGPAVASALLLAGLLATVSSAADRSSTTPATAAEIESRLQRSQELQRRALQILDEPDRAARLIDDAYAELRSGLSGIVINASGMKYPDPLLEINKKNGEEALALMQSARDALKAPPPAAAPDGDPAAAAAAARARLDAVRAKLERALRLTSAVMVH